MVAAGGGVFTFADAEFGGSAGSQALANPIVAVAVVAPPTTAGGAGGPAAGCRRPGRPDRDAGNADPPAAGGGAARGSRWWIGRRSASRVTDGMVTSSSPMRRLA